MAPLPKRIVVGTRQTVPATPVSAKASITKLDIWQAAQRGENPEPLVDQWIDLMFGDLTGEAMAKVRVCIRRDLMRRAEAWRVTRREHDHANDE